MLLTGHTGFKGAWLYQWLKLLGADVYGLALEPSTTPNIFHVLHGPASADEIVDLRNRQAVEKRVAQVQPQVVIHMAAQAIVKEGYKNPVENFDSNIMGTIHLLEALRSTKGLLSVLVVTSDKAYENDDSGEAFAENAKMGGSDPYSASKGCQEIVTHSYRRSFFNALGVPLVTARAGNVVGGGDWSEDRLMTDALTALGNDEDIILRNPMATRPWQHVLEPIAGYLLFAQACAESRLDIPALNFGPKGSATVQHVTEHLIDLWQVEGRRWIQDAESHPKEAHALALDATLADTRLGWKPRLDLETTLHWIVDWHKAFLAGGDMQGQTNTQIQDFAALMRTP